MNHVPLHRQTSHRHAKTPGRKNAYITLVVLVSLAVIASAAVATTWLIYHRDDGYFTMKSEKEKAAKLRGEEAQKTSSDQAWDTSTDDIDVTVVDESNKAPNSDNSGKHQLSHSGSLAGLTVLVDPGHSGGVPPSHGVYDGRSANKPCNNSGTSTNDGYPEHTFNFDVALRLKAKLQSAGAKVIMTRNNDTAPGPCVDERGKMSAKADVVVSIHANGTTNPSVKGYFALVSSPPLNAAQGQPSVDLAQSIMRALAAQGFTASPHYPQGLMKRSDIAGLNYSTKPAVMMELGEMRNAQEAAVMKTEAGRERYAVALFNGLDEWAKTH